MTAKKKETSSSESTANPFRFIRFELKSDTGFCIHSLSTFSKGLDIRSVKNQYCSILFVINQTNAKIAFSSLWRLYIYWEITHSGHLFNMYYTIPVFVWVCDFISIWKIMNLTKETAFTHYSLLNYILMQNIWTRHSTSFKIWYYLQCNFISFTEKPFLHSLCRNSIVSLVIASDILSFYLISFVLLWNFRFNY